jgi:hypothetical protein
MDDDAPLPTTVAAELLAKTAVAILERHYPDWGWAVRVDDLGGVMEVRSMVIPGKWGFLLKIRSIDPEGKTIMRAGGELLERYRLRRGRRKPGATQELMRDFKGMAVPDAG